MAEQKKEVTLDDAYNMVLGHMQQANYRVAELVLKDILEAAPDHHPSQYMMGIALYYMGNKEGAMSWITQAIESDEAKAEWWCNYGILLNLEEDHDQALKAYDKAVEIDPEYPNTYWNKSHCLWLVGDYESAEKAAQAGIDIDPNTPEAWLNLGTAVVKLDRIDDAVDHWKKAIELRPDYADAWNNLGNALRDMGKLEEAENACLKALEYDPVNAMAMNNLANALLDLDRVSEAEEWYRKSIAQKPDYAEAHNNLCISLIQQHRYEEALVSARYASSFKPDYVEAYIHLSMAHRALGNMVEAEQSIQTAVNLNPDSAEVHIDLADVLFMQDRYGDAEIELKKASELEKDSPRLYLKLSNVLERGNKVEEALEAIDKAVELNPEMPEAYLRKGSIYHVANRAEEAKECFEKTLEMRPDTPAALVSMAELYQSLGDLETSREYADKAREVAPNMPGLYQTLSKMKKFTEDDPDFQKMVEIEDGIERFGLEQASSLHFALFSAWQDIGNDEKAFEHLKKGNDFKRKTVPYDPERQKENFEQVKQSYTAETIEFFGGKGFESEQPIFIVGMPRSGTTLTEQLISSHPDVFGAGELLDLSLTDSEFGPLNEENAKRKGEWYVKETRKRDITGKAIRITDKMPGNFASIGKIVSILPQAKIIHCRRNPIDTCLSCYKQNFARGQYWSYNLEEMADYYNMYLDLMAYWRDLLGDRFVEIDYADTVNDLEPQARKLIDYVNLPWNDACLEPHKQKRTVLTASKTQVIKPVYKTSLKAWKRYETQLQPLVQGLEKGLAADLLDKE